MKLISALDFKSETNLISLPNMHFQNLVAVEHLP